MSVFEPTESLPVRKKSSCNMKLPLHCSGDHNGNAFPVSSSSSSSSCLGESSPESLRSLSSLNGGRTDSPLEYDLLEVTLMTTMMPGAENMEDVVLSKWSPEEEEDSSVGMFPTESNDVSVYLDASSGEYHQNTWNDNLTLSLNANDGCHGNDDVTNESCGRRSSTTADSDTTEILDDDDDDEEDALFVSVSSEVCVTLAQVSPGGCAAGLDLQTDAVRTDENKLGSERPQGSLVNPPASLDLRETSPISCSSPSCNHPAEDAPTVTSAPPEEAEICKTQTRPISAGKTSSLEAKRVPKPVKARTGSQNTSPSKTPPQQNKPVSDTARRAVPRKDEVDGGKKSSPGPIKVAVILRRSRGKSASFKANHKVAVTSTFVQPEKKNPVVSEVVGDGRLDAPGKPVQDLLDGVEKNGPPAPRKTELMSRAPETEAADGKQRVPSKLQLLLPSFSLFLTSLVYSSVWLGIANTMVSVRSAELRSLGWDAVTKHQLFLQRFSSRLGPGVRQQGRTNRPDRGPAPPPGSGTGPPGQERSQPGASEESRVVQADGSLAKRQNQNQGIPKPRTSAIAHSPTASIPKPTSNQQPAAGSAGRQPAPTASRLPVKGLPGSLSCSSLGSNENNAANSKASPGAPPPTDSKPGDQPSRGSPSSGSQNTAKPHNSGITSATGDISPSSGPMPPAAGMRSRGPSVQARTSITGLKTPTITNQNMTKMPAGHPPAKAISSAKPPLQRNGSARHGRLNITVDKNKPREAPARPTNSSSQITTGNQQNQQLVPAESVPDVLNANIPVTPTLPVPSPDDSITTSGCAGPTGPALKARTGSRSSPKHRSRLQHASRPGVGGAVAPVGTVTVKQNQNKEQMERKNQAIIQLRRLLVQGNRRVEALAVVIQHLFSEREETLKQKKELSSELAKLRQELVASSQSCQRLQTEKDEVRANSEEALKRLEEQHQEELVQLENRLKCFYQAEWDKVHQLYQEEADKCRLLMEQQVEELRSRQEAEKKKQEESHSQQMEAVKQEYETSIQGLKMIQQTELEDLQKTLKETETSLTEKISALSAENEDLSEKLRVEEERRQQILSNKTVDSHTLYLEQELESIKVVLEIKNNQLHQKEKKLMEMDKLVETNVRLEECLKKVQQENEDYKARMDKHAALSKQLSTEQAILQQTLQKESKVNKRLSMENEELLWKLHNGDLLGSPRRLSPTSPYSSPRNSASFPTAAPLSPR
ncbi:microtubule-associated tumor suppressor 1 homolog isoform X3 [Girardinichthys multiradiatus]|uniref:microtubule-associated tumor suppressor 1 homolog isoform X3 n=1 Tax=Girardinichthys multiradiatus TaxID=208333 RepID=UPI001FABBB0D|nr:microtubule-associated tumor suppressor 1 homolog isoform X3 [Girardinichthys multiradiatus]